MKKLHSVIADDLDHCMFTGSTDTERHHVFNKWAKKYSEKYGYIAPIRADIHPNGARRRDSVESMAILHALSERDLYNYVSFDEYLKMACQKHFEENIGSREVFMSIFGRNYL